MYTASTRIDEGSNPSRGASKQWAYGEIGLS